MFIEIDESTSLNADVPVLYLEDVIAETNDGDIPVTKIVFAVPDTEPLYSTVPRHHLAELLGIERFSMPEPVLDVRLSDPPPPHDGEDSVDYLNRITPQ